MIVTRRGLYHGIDPYDLPGNAASSLRWARNVDRPSVSSSVTACRVERSKSMAACKLLDSITGWRVRRNVPGELPRGPLLANAAENFPLQTYPAPGHIDVE